MWVRAGSGDSTRNIPLHFFSNYYGNEVCSIMPALHHLTGADYTSKVRTKLAAINAEPENFLIGFGSSMWVKANLN